ncbi:HEPN domain-containing protein [bacterium]|nr:HEPN domain-containing protein [bacterium]
MDKEIARKWFKQAKHDLLIAEKNIEFQGYDVSAFLAHQAVEKLLKSLFALDGMKIPKIHFLDELSKRIQLTDDIFDDVSRLTIDYALARYPDVNGRIPCESYNEENARKKVILAKNIFEK